MRKVLFLLIILIISCQTITILQHDVKLLVDGVEKEFTFRSYEVTPNFIKGLLTNNKEVVYYFRNTEIVSIESYNIQIR